MNITIHFEFSSKIRFRSIEINNENGRKPKISNRFTPTITKSVTSQWINQPVNSLSTTSDKTIPEQLLNWFTHSWLESEQNEFLRQLIIKFDERQQYFASCVILQRRYRDFISLLPLKISFHILNYLSLQELSRSRRVCKNWKSIIDQERNLWKPKTNSQLDGINKNKKTDLIDLRTKLYFYLEKTNTQIDWKKIQKQHLAIKRNWLTGTAHIIECTGHTQR
ncbi:unnamed protein product [Adineta steineri]|uniref:F-box domain-containing protein n=1 Tax=Adineta steineri TaxID=433720 RepID=A0A814EHI6_9BILA|nr:unnamed protein product [Adineta steineri]CAF0967764.1 unnamed protein product [Adineta steineri]CAF1091351.1 unnamed protein product [Adineta steineri]